MESEMRERQDRELREFDTQAAAKAAEEKIGQSTSMDAVEDASEGKFKYRQIPVKKKGKSHNAMSVQS
jgi:hypothetical protein